MKQKRPDEDSLYNPKGKGSRLPSVSSLYSNYDDDDDEDEEDEEELDSLDDDCICDVKPFGRRRATNSFYFLFGMCFIDNDSKVFCLFQI